jgi:type VI secretion system Hcp family effector
MFIPGIEGECQMEIASSDADFPSPADAKKKLIEIETFSMKNEVTSAADDGGQTNETVKLGDIEVTRRFDKASIAMINKMVGGGTLGTVKIYFLKPSAVDGSAQVVFMTHTLTNAIISNHAFTGGEDDPPAETISFSFSRVDWEYKMQGEDGTLRGRVAAGFNVQAGTVVS